MTRGSKIALVIVGLLAVFVLLMGLLVVVVVMSLGDEPEVSSNSVLVLNVEGSLPDYSNADELSSRFFGGETNSLSNLLLQLRKAKADKRVGAVLLDIRMLGGGWAKADEIRDAVADFRKSGKPIYAYMEFGGDKEYYVATAAERVYVPPIGDLFINGLAAESMHFKNSFDKLGIVWDSYQIEKYKTAPESFTREDMSEGERETLNSLLDEIFDRYVTQVAAARRKSVEDIRALVDNAPHNAPAALEAGLIDGALYREEVENELKKRLGYKEDEKLRKVSTAEYRRVTPQSLGLNQGEAVAVIFASGPIEPGHSNDGTFGGDQTIGSDTVVKALNDARDNKDVKAIVLRVDSPGGVTYPSDLIWKAVEEAKKRGLVDEFGGLDRAVEVAKGLAKIPADKGVRRIVYPTPRTFIQQLFGGGGDQDAASIRAQQQRAAF